jgi:hypothetical protein
LDISSLSSQLEDFVEKKTHDVRILARPSFFSFVVGASKLRTKLFGSVQSSANVSDSALSAVFFFFFFVTSFFVIHFVPTDFSVHSTRARTSNSKQRRRLSYIALF